jgi:hypothetical protein
MLAAIDINGKTLLDLTFNELKDSSEGLGLHALQVKRLQKALALLPPGYLHLCKVAFNGSSRPHTLVA